MRNSVERSCRMTTSLAPPRLAPLLPESTFADTDLSGAQLSDTNLTNATLSFANLSGANLTDASTSGVSCGGIPHARMEKTVVASRQIRVSGMASESDWVSSLQPSQSVEQSNAEYGATA